MLKTKSFIYPILLFLLLNIGCSTQASAKNSISGEIKSLPKGALQLILEEDINRKKSKIIAEIPIDENGHFDFRSFSADAVGSQNCYLFIDPCGDLRIRVGDFEVFG